MPITGPNFYDKEKNQVITAAMCSKGVEYAEVFYNIPDYDKRLYTHAPVGTLNDVSAMTKQDDGSYMQEYEILPLPIEEAKHNCLEPLAQARYEKEVGGCTISGMTGIETFETDRDKRAELATLVTAGNDVNYKLANGDFVALTINQLKAILNQVNAHVQKCFDRELELKTAIENAESIEELAAIDTTF